MINRLLTTILLSACVSAHALPSGAIKVAHVVNNPGVETTAYVRGVMESAVAARAMCVVGLTTPQAVVVVSNATFNHIKGILTLNRQKMVDELFDMDFAFFVAAIAETQLPCSQEAK